MHNVTLAYPNKVTPTSVLTAADYHNYKKISADRAVVEKRFGREAKP